VGADERADPSLPATAAVGVSRRLAAGSLVAFLLLGNAALIVWLWVHGGNLTDKSTGDMLTSVARLTGLLSAYLALVQVLLLARIPALERLVGFDRLSVWHRWNGHACIDLVLAHVVFSVWGYALLDRFSIPKEISTMLGGGIYPGMITATVGTVLLLGVVASSIVIVRRRLRYEWWHAVHLTAYAGIALAWFHQIPTGNELVLDRVAADYWKSLYVATIMFLVVFRLLVPLGASFRHRLRVADVVEEAPGVVSLRIEGRRLDRLSARAGQFFIWRFLAGGRWWTAHPFSLSRAPDGRSLRITVKALGDHSARVGDIPVGTRVVAEGPFGVFTEAARRREKVLLIAGGIGITPIRDLRPDGGDGRRDRRPLSRRQRRRPRLPRRARPARRRARHRAALRRGRPCDRGRVAAPRARPSPRARAGHRRPRRLRVRPARDDGGRRAQRACRRRSSQTHPR